MSTFNYAYERGSTRAYRGGSYLHNIDPESPVVIRSWTFPAEVSVRNGFRLVVSKGDTVIEPSRVLRGGGWNYDASYARVAVRDNAVPAHADYDIGFRLTVDAEDLPVRVNRGGRWDEDADDVRNTIGLINSAARGYGHLGFRLTVDLDDDYNRGVRGGSWTTPDKISSRGFSNGPDVSYYNTHIGLRLVTEASVGQAFRGSGWYSGSGLRRAYRGVDKVPNVSIGIRTVRDT